MAGKIKISDLSEEVLQQMGISKELARAEMPVEGKLAAMGKVIGIVSKMSNQEALWVLRKVIREITGREEGRGVARKPKTVDK